MTNVIESTAKSLPETKRQYAPLPQQQLPRMPAEPVLKRRIEDQILDAYVKIGSYVGVTLAIGMFILVCAASYNIFFSAPHGLVFTCVVGFFTLAGAISLAVCTFFGSSVLWLPMLVLLSAASSAVLPMLQWAFQMHH